LSHFDNLKKLDILYSKYGHGIKSLELEVGQSLVKRSGKE